MSSWWENPDNWGAIAGGTGALAGTYLNYRQGQNQADQAAQQARDQAQQQNQFYDQARYDALSLLPVQQEYVDQGNRGAMQALQGGFAPQQQALGNATLMARDYLNRGSENYANALMGNPVNQAPVEDRNFNFGPPVAPQIPTGQSVQAAFQNREPMPGPLQPDIMQQVSSFREQMPIQSIDFLGTLPLDDPNAELSPEQMAGLMQHFGISNPPRTLGQMDQAELAALQALRAY